MDGPGLTPLQIILSSMSISSFGGIAALLASKKELTLRSLVAATVYSAVMGTIIALLWMEEYGKSGNPWFLIGVAGLAGIGGINVIDLVVIAAKKSGLKLVLQPKEPENPGG